MSSDLLLAWCPGWEADLDPAALVANLDENTLAVGYEQMTGDMPDEEADPETWKQATRERLIEAFENIESGRAAVTEIYINGMEIIIGGGTSYGDMPDGSMDVLLVSLALNPPPSWGVSAKVTSSLARQAVANPRADFSEVAIKVAEDLLHAVAECSLGEDDG